MKPKANPKFVLKKPCYGFKKFEGRWQNYTADDEWALQLYCNEGPFATLTVCVPDQKWRQADDEILVKSWTENEPVADAFRDSDWFEDTGRRVLCGFAIAEVWKVKPILLED